MFTFKRNQIIITALVVMIAVAGYLNYIDGRSDRDNTAISLNDDGEVSALIPNSSMLKETVTVNKLVTGLDGEIGDALTLDENPEILTISEATEETPAAGEAVFVNKTLSQPYFVQAKLDREQARAKQKELLTEIINNTNVDKDQKSQSAERILEIQKRIEKENAAETMIESKGFTEVYVRIDDDTVDVVVSKEALTDAEIAQIEDIVKRKTGMSADKIRISPIKK